MKPDPVISPDELITMLDKPDLRLVDGSWYLPAQNRDAKAEFARARIANAVFFDIDEISDTASILPHMLPSPDLFEQSVGELGISETDTIIVYDGPGIFSSARVWWTFKVMGAKQIRILDGGLDGWKKSGLPIETGPATVPETAKFRSTLNTEVIRNINDMVRNIESKHELVLDARPLPRFLGNAPEPRPGLASGHIPGSLSLPFDQLLTTNGGLKPTEDLMNMFTKLGVDGSRPIVTTCGSGVTAAIITLALERAGLQDTALYDGSWAEWGSANGVPISSDV